MTEFDQRELRNITKHALHRLSTAPDYLASQETREKAYAALVQLDSQDKDRPDLREPYVYRVRIQPGLWLTVDASRNIMLEVRTTDEAELLAAYALSGVMGMINQLELCRMARDAADEEADAARRAGLADAEWGRRLAAGMGPGDSTS